MSVAFKQDQWSELNVSRETLEKLTLYGDLLKKWQAKINLVGPKTIQTLWERHFLDSAQLFSKIPQGASNLVDIGCGAGFPGMVLAIMGMNNVHLVDSDARKMAFVRDVALKTQTDVTLHCGRIEEIAFENEFDVVTSRALAPLDKLIGYSDRFLKGTGCCLFLKGQKFTEEIQQAQLNWDFTYQDIQSVSDPEGRILFIERIKSK